MKKVVLLACGCFNPPTYGHFRMFEVARDCLRNKHGISVVAGIISPTHNNYPKKGLVDAKHRIAMLKLGLNSSDWLKVSDWEANQSKWSRTLDILLNHKKLLDSRSDCFGDIPKSDAVQLMFLCGADLLESFRVPNLWDPKDIETIIDQFGIVVVSRNGSDPERFIYESDLLTKYQSNIRLVTEWNRNEISSTKIRRAINRHESVKYLTSDSIIDYIGKNKLYEY